MDDLIRIGAAAAALGVSVDTLRRWERDGRVAFERRGNQRWLRSDDLAAPQPLTAEVSDASARRLDLRAGVALVATWKATATRLLRL